MQNFEERVSQPCLMATRNKRLLVSTSQGIFQSSNTGQGNAPNFTGFEGVNALEVPPIVTTEIAGMAIDHKSSHQFKAALVEAVSGLFLKFLDCGLKAVLSWFTCASRQSPRLQPLEDA